MKVFRQSSQANFCRQRSPKKSADSILISSESFPSPEFDRSECGGVTNPGGERDGAGWTSIIDAEATGEVELSWLSAIFCEINCFAADSIDLRFIGVVIDPGGFIAFGDVCVSVFSIGAGPGLWLGSEMVHEMGD